MKTPQFERLAEELLADCLTTMNVTKGKDYAGSEDRLINFKNVAQEAGLEPLQVWLVWVGKHWDAISKAIKENPAGPTKKGEPLRENFKDLIVYALIGNALVEEVTQPKDV